MSRSTERPNHVKACAWYAWHRREELRATGAPCTCPTPWTRLPFCGIGSCQTFGTEDQARAWLARHRAQHNKRGECSAKIARTSTVKLGVGFIFWVGVARKTEARA